MVFAIFFGIFCQKNEALILQDPRPMDCKGLGIIAMHASVPVVYDIWKTQALQYIRKTSPEAFQIHNDCRIVFTGGLNTQCTQVCQLWHLKDTGSSTHLKKYPTPWSVPDSQWLQNFLHRWIHIQPPQLPLQGTEVSTLYLLLLVVRDVLCFIGSEMANECQFCSKITSLTRKLEWTLWVTQLESVWQTTLTFLPCSLGPQQTLRERHFETFFVSMRAWCHNRAQAQFQETIKMRLPMFRKIQKQFRTL